MFPAASDAVQVTVVVPTEKLEPEDGEQVGPEVTPTLSVAVTVNVTATSEPSGDTTEIFPEKPLIICGSSVSAVGV